MKLITQDMMEDLISQAACSSRRRMNLNIHERLTDSVQRLFIAARQGTYFRPHRHPGKGEFALVIRGWFDVLTFDDAGMVLNRVSIGRNQRAFGLDIPPDVWHTWIPREDPSVFFEVKQGPYDPVSSMEFAAWAPEEGSVHVEAFQDRLLRLPVGASAA
jgi:cupin fold WbuC family metalloprotein